MTNKNKIYLLALLSYVVAALGGFLVASEFYWIILLVSTIILLFTLNCIFPIKEKEEFKTMMFDWISVASFTGLELLIVILHTISKLPLSGFVSFINQFTQIAAYVFIGYSVVRYTLEHTSFYKDLLKKKEDNKSSNDLKEDKAKQSPLEIKKIEEKKETPNFDKEEVEIINSRESQEVTSQEFVDEVSDKEEQVKEIEEIKEEETEIKTPYMEEER